MRVEMEGHGILVIDIVVEFAVKDDIRLMEQCEC